MVKKTSLTGCSAVLNCCCSQAAIAGTTDDPIAGISIGDSGSNFSRCCSDRGHAANLSVRRLSANLLHVKANLLRLLHIDNVAPVKEEGRLHHQLSVQMTSAWAPCEAVYGESTISTRSPSCSAVKLVEESSAKAARSLIGGDGGSKKRLERYFLHLLQHLSVGHLGVVDGEAGALVEQVLADELGRRLASVAGVRLEGEAEDGDALVGDGAEEALGDAQGEAPLLVVVQQDDLLKKRKKKKKNSKENISTTVPQYPHTSANSTYLVPVVGHLGQLQVLAEVDQIEDVLLEAAAAEADARLQKPPPDATVRADGVRHLVHVGPGGLADRRDGVDGADALREEGIRRQLRQLRAPGVGGDDRLRADPVPVDLHQLGEGDLRVRGTSTANQDAVRRVEVGDGRPFGEELRVAENLKVHPGGLVGGEDAVDRLGRPHRHRALLHDDLRVGGGGGDQPRDRLEVLQVGRLALAEAEGFGRSVDADEDQLRGGDLRVEVSAEVEVPTAALLHDAVQLGLLGDRKLKYGQRVAVPGLDALRIRVDHADANVRTLLGDHGAGGAAHVAGADAADSGDGRRLEVVHGWGSCAGGGGGGGGGDNLVKR
ncbi:hypothetical protein TYRP_016277 [Tyrophagus putrescentiae]|nr:hypothetical protein TYRP_016277 [Tyrophagus putrescentiae]